MTPLVISGRKNLKNYLLHKNKEKFSFSNNKLYLSYKENK
jgi:hypothetical protein